MKVTPNKIPQPSRVQLVIYGYFCKIFRECLAALKIALSFECYELWQILFQDPTVGSMRSLAKWIRRDFPYLR